MKNLKKYLNECENNKFFDFSSAYANGVYRIYLDKVLSEKKAQKFCDELNQLLLELKEGKRGRILIDLIMKMDCLNMRFVIKDLNEEQWYVRTYKGHKAPNFVSCAGYAKKYKCWLAAKICALQLNNCKVET